MRLVPQVCSQETCTLQRLYHPEYTILRHISQSSSLYAIKYGDEGITVSPGHIIANNNITLQKKVFLFVSTTENEDAYSENTLLWLKKHKKTEIRLYPPIAHRLSTQNKNLVKSTKYS